MTETNTDKEKVQSIPLEAIVKEAKKIEENCLHTSKSHFVSAHTWTKFHLWIGVPTAILAAIVGTLVFASFEQENNCVEKFLSNYGNIIAGIISIIVCTLTAVSTFLNPKEHSNTHLAAGNNYDSLMARARIFWTIDCRREETVDMLTAELKNFSTERDRLNRDHPQPSKGAYKKAKKGIDAGEADYKADKEVVS